MAVAWLGLVVWPAAAAAQGTSAASITGVVKDTSGAVLPGVTVEASSPVMIEGARSTVTDDQGQYRIIELRPGTYAVTFTLPGFGVFKRDGLELSANFTATVNADLNVGELQETVTVSGQSPLVDVTNVTQQKTISKATLDAVPTGKSILGFISLMPAAAAPPGSQDVGGSKGESSMRMSIHGGKQSDQRLLLDGMSYNLLQNPTGRSFFVNPLGAQEFVIEAGSGGSAEYSTGGAQVNLIPKDGANTLNGTVFATGTNDSLQADNLSEDLQAQGLKTVNGVNEIYDLNAVVAGPIAQNKLWFMTAHRRWGRNERIGNVFHDSNINDFLYTPDPSRPANAAEDLKSDNVRLTWQAAETHKVTFHYEYQNNRAANQGGGLNAGTRALEANVRADAYCNRINMYQASWTNPASNKLLFDAGWSYMRNYYAQRAGAGCPAGIFSESLIRDSGSGITYHGTGLREDNNQDSMSTRVNMSYVTGSHNIKVGMQEFHSARYYSYQEQGSLTLPVNFTFRNGRPTSLTEYVTPRYQVALLRPNMGIFVQDQWSLPRLSVNVGLRYDRLRAYAPAVTQPAGFPFYQEVSYPEKDCLPCWNDINPRAAVSYDLFGTGRTAAKVSIGRYVESLGSQSATDYGPANGIAQTTTRSWNDSFYPVGDPRRENFFPDCDLVSTGANAECGAMNNTQFGKPVLNTAPAEGYFTGWSNRGFNWQFSTSVDHELRSGLAVQAGYYRRWFGNMAVNDNTLVTPADYDPYCITAPVDSRLGSVSGSKICGLYDIKPEKFGQQFRERTLASNFGKASEVYNGVDVNFAARLPNGAMAGGGWNIGNTFVAGSNAGITFSKQDNCYVVDSPQQLYNCESANPYLSRFKLNGSYPLPYGLQAAVVYQNVPGATYTGTYTYTSAEAQLTLGRPLAGSTSTASIDLVPTGSGFIDNRVNQLDLRFSKIFRMGASRLQGNFDLYNVLNANTPLQVISTYGNTWLQPTQILDARLLKFSVQMDF
jgi:hypothetical protein